MNKDIKKYEYHIQENLQLVMSVRNYFMSIVTKSSLCSFDKSFLEDNISSLKKKKRKKLVSKLIYLSKETKKWKDIIPSVNEFMDFHEKILNK